MLSVTLSLSCSVSAVHAMIGAYAASSLAISAGSSDERKQVRSDCKHRSIESIIVERMLGT